MRFINARRLALPSIATLITACCLVGGSVTGSPPAPGLNPADIVGMGIASNDKIYTWYADGTRSVGWSRDLDYYQAPQSYSLPPGLEPEDIVGMAIANNDKVYTWYANGTRSVGWSRDLDYYQAPQSYSLPPGVLTTTDIVGMAINNIDRVHTWFGWMDFELIQGSRGVGWSRDLDFYKWPKSYWLPPGLDTTDIVGMGMANNNKVYTWYADGTRSVGKAGDLDFYAAPQSFSMP